MAIMIFYFSATGNSLYTAKTITQNINEDYIQMLKLVS